MLKNKFTSTIWRHLAAVLIVALVMPVLRPFESALTPQIIVLIYLIPVVSSTVFWGLTPGLLAGFAAFLAFNYYYIQPLHTFLVHATRDLITLIIFLIITVLISQLIGQAREGTRLARTREWQATRLYELTSGLAGLQDSHSIAQALARQTLETFYGARSVVKITSRGEPPFQFSAPENASSDSPPSLQMGMSTARGQEGEIMLWLPKAKLGAEEMRLLEAYAGQGALALERIRLTKGENKARVLEESDRLKSSLLNSVSHELRSPLAAIKASVSSLRSDSVDWNSADRHDLLATIEEETDHLNLLVGNLLDMSRIESGALQPQKRWNSIMEIASSAASKLRKQLQEHRLIFDLPDDLPFVPTDFILMQQVFSNLLSNSAKYAPAGTEIRISAGKEQDLLHVQVSNEGPPVSEQDLEQIFEKFHRVTEADRITGTGLGLSICKGIIEAHNGKIWAENQTGRFVYHFSLPLRLDGALPDNPEGANDG